VQCGASGEVLGSLRVLQAEAHAGEASSQAPSVQPRCDAARAARIGRVVPGVGDLALASGRRIKIPQLSVLAQMLLDLGGREDIEFGPHVVASTRAAIQLLYNGKLELAERMIHYLREVQERETNPAVTARIYVARCQHALCTGRLARRTTSRGPRSTASKRWAIFAAP